MRFSAIPRHQLELRWADYAAIARVLIRPNPTAVAAFEREFAAYLGCRHAIAVSSGRLAMHLILEALDASPGQEAIVPAFNLFAVIERFCQLGVAPKFADIRRSDLNIDPVAAERLITPQARFLLATHMFGHAADMHRLTSLAEEHGLILLEDCAHAFGTRYRGRPVGTFGTAAIFSFSVLKLVTTFGGGMIATNDDKLAAGIRSRLAPSESGADSLNESLADSLGRSRLDTFPFPFPRESGRGEGSLRPGKGLRKLLSGAVLDLATRRLPFTLAAWPVLRAIRASRPSFQRRLMTETPRPSRDFDPSSVPPMHPFQAALGLRQLARADEWIAKRREVGRWLDVELDAVPGVQRLRPDPASAWNGLYYGVLADRAPELCEHLFRRGIDSETSEYLNCADLPMYAEHFVDCPVARDVQSRILRLPNFPRLRPKDVQRIARTIASFAVQTEPISCSRATASC